MMKVTKQSCATEREGTTWQTELLQSVVSSEAVDVRWAG